ncbi:uroporphyrinogen-III C-methyltransferase [Aliamphritea spongicola]|uniref:uroporphyrinogen-III C-methyltransferase n=1 Tax=Aliamphritea spongicola TaxID=707589 RepID=UPI00196B8CD5|nr:uroporphyrinogen-III C-methyltransferase [Aliamphritea spongicola]MBN3564185.1 uroporphyrinogen-III C-methyltransferase [Aliamphritea spongicola]
MSLPETDNSPSAKGNKARNFKSNACVYLVGAGPGDPDLLTVKAQRLIREADAVVYDRLVSEEIIAQIPAGVARIYVGKATGRHSLPQDEINQLLVKLAKGYRHIVRLKGGDPFIFGRGSEEAAVLTQNNVRFEIVPGITSAMACAAYAGIPLTHRGVADGVHIVTGHRQNDQGLELDLGAFSDSRCTLAVYMGLANLTPIVNAVLAAGRSASTPVAVIEKGTTPQQRRLVTDLAHLVADTADAGIKPPAMVVIGDVVNLAATLDWFEPASEPIEQQSMSQM